jgi:hypothetical protein
MNQTLRISFLVTVMMISALRSFAGGGEAGVASANASIGATIVTPFTASKESDLEFQNVTIGSKHKSSKHAGGKVEVVAENVVSANINITGAPGYAYSITIPTSVSVSDNATPLTVNIENCSGAQLSSNGTGSISIEGTISYGASAMIASADDVPNGLPVIINNN